MSRHAGKVFATLIAIGVAPQLAAYGWVSCCCPLPCPPCVVVRTCEPAPPGCTTDMRAARPLPPKPTLPAPQPETPPPAPERPTFAPRTAEQPTPAIEPALQAPQQPGGVEAPAEETPEPPTTPIEETPTPPAPTQTPSTEDLFDGSGGTPLPTAPSSTLGPPTLSTTPGASTPPVTPAALPSGSAPTPAPETPAEATPPQQTAPPNTKPDADDLFDISRVRRVLEEPGGWSSEQLRSWSDTSGTYRCDAHMVAVSPDGIVLDRADGVTVRVAYGALSVADLQFVHRQIEARQKQLAADGAAFAAAQTR